MRTVRQILSLLLLSGLTMGTAAQEQPAPKPQAYTIYAVCGAHLDTQWNWDIQPTINTYIPRILFQNLWLFERYPDYVFNFEGGQHYAWMKEYYPEQFARIRPYVQKGRWHVSGSSWNANDPNVPSPESFFRNILLGQQFYLQEFGVRSTDIFLPDCFGFGYTLPTIAAHCGLTGMSTQKLGWRKHNFYDHPQHKKNPFSWGVWYGIDGQSLMAAFDTGGYNDPLKERTAYDEDLIARASRGFENTAFRYYSGGGPGVGDRGNSGSPMTCIRLAEAVNDKNAPVRVISATSDQLFKDFASRRDELPSYDGELLMDVHATGCYTSQAAMKYYNRRNEELAGAAEKASVTADWLGAKPYDRTKLSEIWKRFIWHQFHDDLTGTSIPDAYRWSWNDELIALRQSGDVMTTAVGALSYSLNTHVKGIPVVVYNPVTYAARDFVEAEVALNPKYAGVAVYSPSGKRVPAQVISRNGDLARIIFAADVPSVGYAVYDVRPAKSGLKAKSLRAGERTLENRVYKLTLDANGDIASIRDKRFNRELVAEGKAFRLAVFEGNKSYQWPAWEILKEAMDKEPVAVDDNVNITVEEEGPLRATLRVERTYGDSKLVQYISLTEGAADERIDVRNETQWASKGVLLKAEFPCAVANEKATYDLGIGYIKRGNNTETAYEVPAHKWADLTDSSGEYGISILNDSKYGWDKPTDNMIRLTLLHTPEVQKRYPHQGTLDNGYHNYVYSIVGHSGSHGDQTLEEAEKLNQRMIAFVAPKHTGHLGRIFSMLDVSTPQIAVRALKKAENGDGYIVRCYEMTGFPVENARIKFPAAILSAEECNGIEERIADADFEGNSLLVDAGKFAPKTYRVRLAAPQKLTDVRIVQAPVELPYNTTGYTTDDFFSYWYIDNDRASFAGELIPEEIDCNGIRFTMGEANIEDLTKCQGQEIKLPEGDYSKLYMLVSASNEDVDAAEFKVGNASTTLRIPRWTGFYGQWGWTGNSESFLRDERIGYIGTHTHSQDEKNRPYVFSYMYLMTLDIPAGAKTVTLPDNENVMVYAMTAASNPIDDVTLAGELFVRPDAK